MNSNKKCKDIQNKVLNKNSGQMLGFIMIIIAVFAIFIPTLVNLLKNETRWSLKHKRSTIAFHLAEAAIDRGLWKLGESKDMWESVADGSFADDYSGYVGSGEFTDVEGGTYKIIITTTSDEFERKIVGVGKDSSTNEMRSIELIVKNVAVESAVSAPSLYVQGGVTVHWGPIQSLDQMDLQGQAASRYYPRKYSVGKIDPRDTDPFDDDNTDGIEYWAYDETVRPPPGIKFPYYIALATANGTYWPGDHDIKAPNAIIDTHGDAPVVYYVNGDCQLKNSYLVGTLIVKGDLTLTGNGKGAYNADIPDDAEDEYQSDQGNPDTAQDVWDDEFDGLTEYGITKVVVEGLCYVEKDLKGAGGATFNGCLQVKGSMAGLTGNVEIYYNEDIAMEVETTELNIVRVSWIEIKPSW